MTTERAECAPISTKRTKSVFFFRSQKPKKKTSNTSRRFDRCTAKNPNVLEICHKRSGENLFVSLSLCRSEPREKEYGILLRVYFEQLLNSTAYSERVNNFIHVKKNYTRK